MPISLSRAWKPVADDYDYATVDLRMADAFERADNELLGFIEIRDRAKKTTLERAFIEGRTDWFDRFDWLNWDAVHNCPSAHDWRVALGGDSGGERAMSGVHVLNASVRFRWLSVSGVPGCGLRFEVRNPPAGQPYPELDIDGGILYRTGWPIVARGLRRGSVLRNLTSVGGHWWSDAWGYGGQVPPVSLRGAFPGVSARGELVMSGDEWVLQGYTHLGDGVGLKVDGTHYLIDRYSGGPMFLQGSGAEIIEPQIAQPYANSMNLGAPPYPCLFTVSGHGTEPIIVRGGVIRRSSEAQRMVGQLSLGAWVVFDGTQFIGWGEDLAKLFELDVVPLHLPEFVGGAKGYEN